VELVLNPILVFFIIKEVPTKYALVGVFLIILGQILNVIAVKRKRAQNFS